MQKRILYSSLQKFLKALYTSESTVGDIIDPYSPQQSVELFSVCENLYAGNSLYQAGEVRHIFLGNNLYRHVIVTTISFIARVFSLKWVRAPWAKFIMNNSLTVPCFMSTQQCHRKVLAIHDLQIQWDIKCQSYLLANIVTNVGA